MTTLTYADPEIAVKDLLKPYVAATWEEEEATCTVGGPAPAWFKHESPPHVAVAWDGTYDATRGVTKRALVRVTVFAGEHQRTLAKTIAIALEGRLTGHDGSGDLSTIRSSTGVVITRDEQTGAVLASFTVSATVRLTPA